MSNSQISGIGSGIDWKETINQLMQIEKRPLIMKQQRKQEVQSKISAWDAIKTKLNSLQSTLDSMDTLEEMMRKKASSSDESVVSVSASEKATTGSYDLAVNKLANSDKIITNMAVESLGDSIFESDGTFILYTQKDDSGNFINPIELDVTTDTDLSLLKRKINNETSGEVSASILDDGNGYRLVLTSKKTGKDFDIKMEGTAVLKDGLEFRDSAIGDVGRTQGDGTALISTFENNYTGQNEEYTFTVDSASYVGDGVIGGAGNTINIEVRNSNGDLVTTFDAGAGYTPGDKIVLENGVEIAIANDDGTKTISQNDQFSLYTTPQTAQNSQIVIENLIIEKSGNVIDDVIEGVSLDLKQITPENEKIDIVIENDKEGVTKLVQGLVSDFNGLVTAIEGYTKWDQELENGGALFGNSQAKSVINALSMIISEPNSGSSNETYKTLSQVGLKIKDGGRLSLDSSKFQKAIDENYEEVIKLFTFDLNISGADNDNFIYKSHSRNTKGGIYDLNVNYDASGKIVQALINGKEAKVDGNFITGVKGEASDGLMFYVDIPSGGTAGSLSAQAKVSTGKNVELSNRIERYVMADSDRGKGTINVIQEGLKRTIDNYDSQIESMNKRLERKRQILEKQWLAMEKYISSIKSQDASNRAMMG